MVETGGSRSSPDDMRARLALLLVPLMSLGAGSPVCGFAMALALFSCGGGGGSGAAPDGDAGTFDGTTHGDAGDAGHSAHDGGTGAETGGDAGGEAGGSPAVGASVLQFHNHVNRDGYFLDPLLTSAAAAGIALDATFDGMLSGSVWASPVYVENGPGGKGTFFVATANDTLYALDETTGKPSWRAKAFGTPANQSGAGCGNVSPIGITGTPAVDLVTRLIVFDAVTGDANGNIATHTIYGVSIDDGSTKWSVDVSTLKDSTGLAFSPQPQNQRGAVLIVNGIAYVVFGGHGGDCGSYHGWVVAVPLSGTGVKAWATQVAGAGIWAVGGAASDGQSIFVATGNGIGGSSTTWQESEGILRLDPGPSFTGQPADYFAPNNWATLDADDLDISGSGPLVIDAPGMTPSALVMAQGKDGNVYLMSRTNLGGVTMPQGAANVGQMHVSTGALSNGNAWASIGGTTYVVVRPGGTDPASACPNGTSGDMVALKLDPTVAEKMTVAWCASSGGAGSPIITSTDGTNDGLVWVVGAEGDSALHAFHLADGTAAGTSAAAPLTNGEMVHHFATVAAVHGRIFVTADDHLFAYKGP
jgi:hypothetical protein